MFYVMPNGMPQHVNRLKASTHGALGPWRADFSAGLNYPKIVKISPHFLADLCAGGCDG